MKTIIIGLVLLVSLFGCQSAKEYGVAIESGQYDVTQVKNFPHPFMQQAQVLRELRCAEKLPTPLTDGTEYGNCTDRMPPYVSHSPGWFWSIFQPTVIAGGMTAGGYLIGDGASKTGDHVSVTQSSVNKTRVTQHVHGPRPRY